MFCYPTWMKEWHVQSNEVADTLADTAAEFHAIPVHKAQPILDVLQNLKLIQNKILHAISLYPQRVHNKPIIPKPTLSKKQLLYSTFAPSTHSLSIIENRVVCANCSSVPAWVSWVALWQTPRITCPNNQVHQEPNERGSYTHFRYAHSGSFWLRSWGLREWHVRCKPSW